MPSSRPHHIPLVIQIVQRLQPDSILDIGAGFGKWGFLFREYTDISAAEAEPSRYEKPHWKIQIDGIEGFEQYITPVHRFVYDNIHIGEASAVLDELGEYDLIFLGDMIEHLGLPEGKQLLNRCLEHARTAVLVSTPFHYIEQGAACGNELEIHRSHWTASDFKSLAPCITRHTTGDVLLALYLKKPIPDPTREPLLPRFIQGIRARGGLLKAKLRSLFK